MSKRKTAGERAAYLVQERATSRDSYFFGVAADIIDRAIRRAQARAWYEGSRAGAAEYLTVADVPRNPYRGRKK